MRILHAPIEVSGQLTLASDGLKAIGHVSEGLCAPHPLAYSRTGTIKRPPTNRYMRRLSAVVFLGRWAAQYDVFHYYFAVSIYGNGSWHPDATFFRTVRRRVIVQFMGSEVRVPTVARQQNPFYVQTQNEDDDAARRRMQIWSRLTKGHAICIDPTLHVSLREFFPHIYKTEALVDTEQLRPHYPDPLCRVPLVVHAPTHHVTKGTEIVRNAIAKLQGKGVRVKYHEIHRASHTETLAAMSKADLVVDQLRLGHYGVVTAEAMALGKPVITYILPEYVNSYPVGLPIINANPETVVHVLEEWLQRPAEDRHLMGMRCRRYAENVFDYRVGAQKLLKIYKGLPR